MQNTSWATWLHSWQNSRLPQHREMVVSWSRASLRQTLTVPKQQHQEQVSTAQLCKADGHITLCCTAVLPSLDTARLLSLEAAAECCSLHGLTDQSKSLHISLGNERRVQALLSSSERPLLAPATIRCQEGFCSLIRRTSQVSNDLSVLYLGKKCCVVSNTKEQVEGS